MLKQEKLSHIVAAALLIIAVSTVAVAEYFGLPVYKTLTDRQVFCTQEAKLCPDGSAVGRTSPNCEFAECSKLSFEQVDTSGWQTYRNEEYGFEFRYPKDWRFEAMGSYDDHGNLIDPQSVFLFTDPHFNRMIIHPLGPRVSPNVKYIIEEKITNADNVLMLYRKYADNDKIFGITLDPLYYENQNFQIYFTPVNAKEYL